MTEPRDPETIEHEIEATRHELAETAAAIAQKADVKSRAAERVEEVKQDAREKVDEAKEKVAGTAHAAASARRRNPRAAGLALLLIAVGYYLVRHRN